MFQEITAEILELSRDFSFIRNLSLTSLVAIACLFSLADLQSQNTKVSEHTNITNVSYSSTKLIVER